MKNIIIAIIVLIVFAAFSIVYSQVGYYKEEAAKVNLEHIDKKEVVTVYFPTLPDIELAGYQIEIEGGLSREGRIERIIEELISGPKDKNSIPVIPAGTKLNFVKISDNTVNIDFSKEFVDNHPGGSMGEYNTIYSIINSIRGIGEIGEIRFTVEGDKLETYEGYMGVEEPF